MNGLNKLESYTALGFPVTNTLAYYTHLQVMKKIEVLWICLTGLYSQNFFFFVTYEWDK